MYLFETNYTANETIAIGDGSYLKLINCEEGWFVPNNFKTLVDEQDGWTYTEVDSITPIYIDPLA